MRSLTLKLVLILLLTSLVGIGLVAFFVQWTTTTEFNRLLTEQALEDYTALVTAHYLEQGSWRGVDRAIPRPGLGSGGSGNQGDRRGMPFLLVDESGKAAHNARGIQRGDAVPRNLLQSGEPLTINGQQVGLIVHMNVPPERDPREDEYIQRTNRALLGGAVGAGLIALVIGMVLARSLLKPLRELTGAIRAMNTGQLEQRVNVQTRDELGELATAFNQMSEALAKSNQLRKQMTADIAHELRTPLTVISGYLEGLQDGTLQPTDKRFRTMYAEAMLLQRLIDDLRTISLADAGELPLTRQPVNTHDLLENVAALFQHKAGEQGVRVVVRADDSAPPLSLDRDRMAQVLSNLVSNALRYTPEAGQITLGASAGDGCVTLSVADTGQGIPAEKLPYIFERFYRADSARSQDSGQSGLGLAIAKSITKAHGGTIHAESEIGTGTTIMMRFPVRLGLG